MRIGVRLRTSRGRVSPDEMARTAGWIEQIGFDSIWVGEHVLMSPHINSRYPYAPDRRWRVPQSDDWLDPLLALTWAGARAQRLALGTSVVIVPLHHPVLLAKQVATLDVMTGGRVTLGIGVGWMREEFDSLGIPFDERWTRTIEAVQLMRALWSGEQTTFAGRHFAVERVVSRPTPQRVPGILWGGHTPRALRAAVEHGDGWHPHALQRGQFEVALRQLGEICDERRRDRRTLTLVVSLPRSETLTAEAMAWYAAHGVRELVWSPRETAPDALRHELETAAAMCEVSPPS